TGSGMRVERVEQAPEFLALTADVRAREPVLTNVIGSVAQTVAEGRMYDECFWWVVRDGTGEVVGCAMRTTPWNLAVSPMPAEAAAELAAAVAAADPGVPGLTGPPDVVDRVLAGLRGAGLPVVARA